MCDEQNAIADNGTERKERLQKGDADKWTTTDRDPRGINQHFKVHFDHVIAEPDPKSRSLDQVWKISTNIFDVVSTWCYRVLSLLLAIPCAFIWAVLFAIVSFFSIWCFQPLAQTLHLLFIGLFQAYEKVVRSLLEPIASALGRCYGNIRVTQLTTDRTIPNATAAVAPV